ncbi:MAG TPA: hypothetical protein PKD63_01210 [Solirubrobacteraceae bacterium]|nr:hypothetical protein [Solirubrobacteraceae bacterium]
MVATSELEEALTPADLAVVRGLPVSRPRQPEGCSIESTAVLLDHYTALGYRFVTVPELVVAGR